MSSAEASEMQTMLMFTSSKFFHKVSMLSCNTENVSGDSSFEKPILTSEDEKYQYRGKNIVLKEIDIKILVTVRKIVVDRKKG